MSQRFSESKCPPTLINSTVGKKRNMGVHGKIRPMAAEICTQFDASPETVWGEVKKPEILLYVARGMMGFAGANKFPLITILGFSKRIKEKKGNIDSAIQTIMDSAQNMQRIVDDVLDFAKPVRLALKEEDVKITLCRACHTCITKAQEKNIKLVPHMPANPSKAAIDGFQLERALVNFICNAIDACGTGQTINILLSQGQGYLAIRIQDHGAGMDKGTVENMFIPFYSNKNNGTGLGMPIAKKIIEGHEGTIDIESHPGTGTEVLIRLPYRPGNQ